MKLVINKCFGGFSLSAKAVARYAELQGRPCFFFEHDLKTRAYTPLSLEAADKAFMFFAFDVPNPGEVLIDQERWHEMTMEKRRASNEVFESHQIKSRPDNRADPLLVQVVEELGDAANGSHAELKVVEIPDGVEWAIDEYDGVESVHEVHRSWA